MANWLTLARGNFVILWQILSKFVIPETAHAVWIKRAELNEQSTRATIHHCLSYKYLEIHFSAYDLSIRIQHIEFYFLKKLHATLIWLLMLFYFWFVFFCFVLFCCCFFFHSPYFFIIVLSITVVGFFFYLSLIDRRIEKGSDLSHRFQFHNYPGFLSYSAHPREGEISLQMPWASVHGTRTLALCCCNKIQVFKFRRWIVWHLNLRWSVRLRWVIFWNIELSLCEVFTIIILKLNRGRSMVDYFSALRHVADRVFFFTLSWQVSKLIYFRPSNWRSFYLIFTGWPSI